MHVLLLIFKPLFHTLVFNTALIEENFSMSFTILMLNSILCARLGECTCTRVCVCCVCVCACACVCVRESLTVCEHIYVSMCVCGQIRMCVGMCVCVCVQARGHGGASSSVLPFQTITHMK